MKRKEVVMEVWVPRPIVIEGVDEYVENGDKISFKNLADALTAASEVHEQGGQVVIPSIGVSSQLGAEYPWVAWVTWPRKR